MSSAAHLEALIAAALPTDEAAAAFGRLIGQALDEQTARAARAVAARHAQVAPEDALALIGQNMARTRFPREPSETYRRRLSGAFEFWKLAGTLPGMVLALDQAGYKATVIEHFRDPDPVRWAEFSIHLVPARPLPGRRWGDGSTWGNAHWGFDPNAVPLEHVLDLVREVKPAHSRLRRLTYSPYDLAWGIGGEWGARRVEIAENLYGQRFGRPQRRVTVTEEGRHRWGSNPRIVLYDLYPSEAPKE